MLFKNKNKIEIKLLERRQLEIEIYLIRSDL